MAKILKVPNAELDYKLSDYASMTAYMDLLLKEETYEHFNEAKHWDFIVRQGRAQELVGKVILMWRPVNIHRFKNVIIYGKYQTANSIITKQWIKLKIRIRVIPAPIKKKKINL